jgi:hypothetical protein
VKDTVPRIVIATAVLVCAFGILILAIRSKAASASIQAEVNADVFRKREAAYLEGLKQKRNHAAMLLSIQQHSLKQAESNLERTSKVYSDSQIQPAELKYRADAELNQSKREAIRIRNDISSIEQRISEINEAIMRHEKERAQNVL